MLKFKGHPLHIALVHFPIACFVLSFVADLLPHLIAIPYSEVVSFYLVAAGCLTGFLALTTGFIDLVSITDKPAMNVALLHGGLNLLWVCVFSFFAIISLRSYPDIHKASAVHIIIKGFCVTGLFVSNYLGGQLILKHKVLENPGDRIQNKPN